MDSSKAEERRLFENAENQRLYNNPENFGDALDDFLKNNSSYIQILSEVDGFQMNGAHDGQSVIHNIDNYINSFDSGSNMPGGHVACQAPGQMHNAAPNMPETQPSSFVICPGPQTQTQPENISSSYQDMESLTKPEANQEVKKEVVEEEKGEEKEELKAKIMQSIEGDGSAASRNNDFQVNDNKMEPDLPRSRKAPIRKKAPTRKKASIKAAPYPPINNHQVHGNPRPSFDFPQMNNNGMQGSPQFHPIHPEMQYQGVYGHPPAPHPNAAGNFGASPRYPTYHPNGPESHGMIPPSFQYPPPPPHVGIPGTMMGPPIHQPNYAPNFAAVRSASYPDGPGNSSIMGSPYPPPRPYQ